MQIFVIAKVRLNTSYSREFLANLIFFYRICIHCHYSQSRGLSPKATIKLTAMVTLTYFHGGR